MGLMNKLRSATGAPSSDLMENGLLGRGEIVNIEATGMSISTGSGENAARQQQVCKITLRVSIDNTEPYEAKVRQKIPVLQITQLQQPGVTVCVRVDPEDHQKVAMDLHTPPPTVTASAQQAGFSLAEVLATGQPAHLAITVNNGPMGMKSPAGLEVYSYQGTLLVPGEAPRSVSVASAVPAGGVPLLYPGSKMPAKFVGDHIAVDWDAAIAEASNPSV